MRKSKKNPRDNDGRTPLHLAAIYGQLKCFETLIKGGAERLPKTNNGKTPLDLASHNHRSEVASILRKFFWMKFKGLKMT